MKTLIKKEIRLLLPAWIAAMLLAVFSTWITGMAGIAAFSLTGWPQRAWLPDDWFTLGVPLIFALGTLFLGISSFGGEFSSGAFTILLSQPAERRRIWRMKTATLSIAFASVWLAAVISFWGMLFVSNYLSNEHAARGVHAGKVLIASFNLDAFKFFTISALVTFSGGLWTTLLLRQITMAFWVTLLAPMAICMGAGLILDFTPVSDQFVNVSLLIALFIYSIAGFFYARKLFFNAQDVQWTGGNLVFSLRKENAEQTGSFILNSFRNRYLTLIWKEIKLHEISLFLAVILLVINFAAMALHAVVTNSNAKMALEFTWALWLLMPLLIGCSAVAEERRLGVAESQLCLPVPRLAQFFIKFFIALILSVILGAVAPSVIERTRNFGVTDWPDFWIFYLAPAIFFVSFYASSLARSTLQAIGFTVLVAAAITFYEFATATGVRALDNVPSEWLVGLELLKLYLGSIILIGALGCLAFWNFKWLHEDRKLWRRNVTAVLAAFGCIFVLTNGIYFRAWEFFTPAESPNGPIRLSNSSGLKFVTALNTLYTTLPDGRLWSETLAYNEISNRWLQSDILVPARSHAQFITGSNWVDMTADYFQTLGIHSDGGLWSIQRKWNPSRGRWNQTGPFIVAKIGSNRDWSQAAGESVGFLLLKKDGSLWTWGTHGYNWRNRNSIPKKLKLDLTTLPVHIGGQTKWTDLFSSRGSAYAEKNDGSIWRWTGWNDTNYASALVQETNFNNQWSSFAYVEQDSCAGIKTNGELFYCSTIFGSAAQKNKTRFLEIQLGQNAKWKQTAYAGWNSIIAIRDDGTLWDWSLWRIWNNSPLVKPIQEGNHSDWIALGGYWDAGFALAADGSLWAWNQPSAHIWLTPSRRPVYMGNIFQATETTP